MDARIKIWPRVDQLVAGRGPVRQGTPGARARRSSLHGRAYVEAGYPNLLMNTAIGAYSAYPSQVRTASPVGSRSPSPGPLPKLWRRRTAGS